MSEDLSPKPTPSEREEKRLREEYGLDTSTSTTSALAYSGIEFAGIVVVSLALGLWLDSHFGTKPWLLLVLLFMGMAGGMTRLIRRALREANK